MKEARGHSVAGKKQIAVRMPEAVFEMLRVQAVMESCPIQHKILDYIIVGLEVDRDWGIEEGKRLGEEFWDQ